MTTPATVTPLRIADADRRIRHVFVRDLRLDAHIGVHKHEKNSAQPVRINIDLTVAEEAGYRGDRLKHVVDYEKVVDKVKAIVAGGHLNLVETLAERIAQACLEDRRILAIRVRVEKLAAIAEAVSVGVEIERTSPFAPAPTSPEGPGKAG
jgi:dihydroneopterin aldolase